MILDKIGEVSQSYGPLIRKISKYLYTSIYDGYKPEIKVATTPITDLNMNFLSYTPFHEKLFGY